MFCIHLYKYFKLGIVNVDLNEIGLSVNNVNMIATCTSKIKNLIEYISNFNKIIHFQCLK